MKHVKITAFDLPDVWYQALKKIYEEGDVFRVGHGSEETETKKLAVALEILHPENKPLLHENATCDMQYVNRYFAEYLWFGEKKPDETYTYASRMRTPVDQVNEAINRYVEELFDRQITIVIRRPEDIYKKIGGKRHEPPCLTILDTEISRDPADNKLKLFLTSHWRSWDGVGGLPPNLAGLQLFSEQFVKELNARGMEKYREKWEKVDTGKMICNSKNLHIYERLYPFVEELLKTKTNSFGEKMKNKD